MNVLLRWSRGIPARIRTPLREQSGDVHDAAGDAVAGRRLAPDDADSALPLLGQRARRLQFGHSDRPQDLARPQRDGRSARFPPGARHPLQTAARRRFRTAEPQTVFRRGLSIHR